MGTNIYSLLKRYNFFINCLFYISIDELKSVFKKIENLLFIFRNKNK